jgi:hypothetical protein
MGAFFGSALIGFGLVFFFIALIAVFRPLPKFKMPTRKAAAAGMALSVASCVSGVPFMPTDQDIAKAVAVEQAEASAANDALKMEISTEWQSLLDAVEPCDEANTRAVEEMQAISEGRGSVYEAYASAEHGAAICRKAHYALRELDVPERAEGKLRDNLSKSLKTCADAYLLRQMSLEAAQSILDGDIRPSAVNEFKEQAEGAQAGTLACVAGYMSAAMDAGVEIKEMQEKS